MAPGSRYIGLGIRRRETASCSALAPFGQSRPSLTGLSGSPSICSSSTLPSGCVFVYASIAHPTAQYGQIVCETVAPSMRSVCLIWVAGSRSNPSGETVTALVAVNWRNCRRVTSTSAPFDGATYAER